MSIAVTEYGVTKEGEKIQMYRMKNKKGMEVSVINWGACLVDILVPDREGKLADVNLGFDSLAGYEVPGPNFGAFIGRVGNRIKDAKFTLNGKTYTLDANNGKNSLHGGFKSYARMVYEAEYLEGEEEDSVSFSRLSPDGEQGFPGNLDLTCTYTLTDENELLIEYFATSDADTLCNLTNHSYFNLAGHNSGSVEKQEVWIRAKAITATTDDLIPTGEIRDITGTPSDFTKRTPIGKDLHADFEPIRQGHGYDQNYCVDAKGEELEKVAELYDPESGRKMEVFSQLPGLQFYTGNSLNITEHGKGGAVYQANAGCCFETQYYPNACNIDSFQGCTLKAKEEYDVATLYKFSVE